MKAANIAGLREYASAWALPAHLLEAVETEPPVIDRRDLALHRTANAEAARRTEIETELASPDFNETDWVGLYQQRLGYELALERYQVDVRAFEVWQEERAQKLAEAAQLRSAVAPLGALSVQLRAPVAYETAHGRFLAEQAAYERGAGTAKDLRGQSDAWKRGKTAMLRLRVLVNQHLLPSLNSVASKLIARRW